MSDDYKCPHDVERVYHLILAAHYMRDYPATSALAASIVRELSSINAKQMELDSEEKKGVERKASMTREIRENKEEANSNPLHAPSAPRRS
jgi:hypothetical protein